MLASIRVLHQYIFMRTGTVIEKRDKMALGIYYLALI